MTPDLLLAVSSGLAIGIALGLVRAAFARRASAGVVDSFTLSLGETPGEIVAELQTDDRRRFSFTWDSRLAHVFSDQLLTAAARSVPPKTF